VRLGVGANPPGLDPLPGFLGDRLIARRGQLRNMPLSIVTRSKLERGTRDSVSVIPANAKQQAVAKSHIASECSDAMAHRPTFFD
jgi:hypothetical protein